MRGGLLWLGTAWLVLAAWGCTCSDRASNGSSGGSGSGNPAATLSSGAAPGTVGPAPSSGAAAGTRLAASARTGSSLHKVPGRTLLLVANEDHASLQLVPLPFGSAPVLTQPLPGRPAQVVSDGQRVWVTIRQPSLLWSGLLPSADALTAAALSSEPVVQELGRVALPTDAWGLALTADAQRAVVSSAWAGQVSVVDLALGRVVQSLAVAREPRGVTLDARGQAWISHLVGAQLTTFSAVQSPLDVTRVQLPAAPLRTPPGRDSAPAHGSPRVDPVSPGSRVNPASPEPSSLAALGYALTLAPDESRLFVARHALGALGKNTFYGATSVDVLRLPARSPVLPLAGASRKQAKSQLAQQLISGADVSHSGASVATVTQPRAMLYRKRSATLLVAGEGDDRVAELDALAPDPTQAVLAVYPLGAEYHPEIQVAKHCAAPTGLALSDDELQLWVYCRGTADLAELSFDAAASATSWAAAKVTARLALGADPLGPGGATGRKLFYSAREPLLSGGLACAGCHPDGRDDGHTWHEATFTTEDGEATNFVAHAAQLPFEAHTQGYARRTAMLAGRVNVRGPFGWHAESPTITERIVQGFSLHRWGGTPAHDAQHAQTAARALADFLRRGLVAPERVSADAEAVRRGRNLFYDGHVGCAACHQPETGYTERDTYELPPEPPPPGYDADPVLAFKTPSLRHLVGRAPYYHDGSAASLEELIANNGTRMGDTQRLSATQQADLVAFLKSL